MNDDEALKQTVQLDDSLPPDHLARFVGDSVAQRDLSALSAQEGLRGGEPSAPDVVLGMLLDGFCDWRVPCAHE